MLGMKQVCASRLCTFGQASALLLSAPPRRTGATSLCAPCQGHCWGTHVPPRLPAGGPGETCLSGSCLLVFGGGAGVGGHSGENLHALILLRAPSGPEMTLSKDSLAGGGRGTRSGSRVGMPALSSGDNKLREASVPGFLVPLA